MLEGYEGPSRDRAVTVHRQTCHNRGRSVGPSDHRSLRSAATLPRANTTDASGAIASTSSEAAAAVTMPSTICSPVGGPARARCIAVPHRTPPPVAAWLRSVPHPLPTFRSTWSGGWPMHTLSPLAYGSHREENSEIGPLGPRFTGRSANLFLGESRAHGPCDQFETSDLDNRWR